MSEFRKLFAFDKVFGFSHFCLIFFSIRAFFGFVTNLVIANTCHYQLQSPSPAFAINSVLPVIIRIEVSSAAIRLKTWMNWDILIFWSCFSNKAFKEMSIFLPITLPIALLLMNPIASLINQTISFGYTTIIIIKFFYSQSIKQQAYNLATTWVKQHLKIISNTLFSLYHHYYQPHLSQLLLSFQMIWLKFVLSIKVGVAKIMPKLYWVFRLASYLNFE